MNFQREEKREKRGFIRVIAPWHPRRREVLHNRIPNKKMIHNSPCN